LFQRGVKWQKSTRDKGKHKGKRSPETRKGEGMTLPKIASYLHSFDQGGVSQRKRNETGRRKKVTRK